MLTKDFNQNEKRYRIKMYGQRYYALSELMRMTLRFLREQFAVTDLSLAEGVILRRCVEAAATARERDLRGGVKYEWLAKPYEEACYDFIDKAYGLDAYAADQIRYGIRGAWPLVLWIEHTRDQSFSNGLDRRPLFDKCIAHKMKKAIENGEYTPA